MTGDVWEDRLSEYLDDEMEPSERAACERHVAACGSCRQSLADLRQLVAQAPRLKRPVAPPHDLWPGVVGRMQPHRAAWRSGVATGTRRTWWLAPGFAAAAVLVLACLAGLIWFTSAPPTTKRVAQGTRGAATGEPRVAPPAEDMAYEDSVANLRRSAHARLTADPQVVNVLEDNLSALDRAIAEYQDALGENPMDQELRHRLAEARQHKLELLRHAAAASVEGTN